MILEGGRKAENQKEAHWNLEVGLHLHLDLRNLADLIIQSDVQKRFEVVISEYTDTGSLGHRLRTPSV